MRAPSPVYGGGVGVGATRVRESARGVFAGQLWRDVGVIAGRLLRRLLMHLQAGLASPGALQLVLHVEGEPSETVDLQLDLVAVHARVEDAMVGDCSDDVARLLGVERGKPLDATRDRVRHVSGGVVLY